ncbi:unnamed protein product [Microthlaspi erraticum]|uniref:Leucine-rich repeat-containing N-terminal plant-type domain-containing protein n=1 Tax=Microthlaspi erraticum TaxID=1685480 RepID=A0A6D2HG72_9BRAS|nr:unnamed protein product [Microthlaspi erraticum]
MSRYIVDHMYGLDLSSNQLSGEIPVEIGDLEGFKSLNLSSNRLTGSIPYSISKLKDLESLDLSNNELSGNIPPCNPTRAPEESANEEEDDEVIDMEWFYWTCGAVYISTCLAVFVFLCIDTRWSQEWFYRVDLFIHHLQRFKRSAFRN